MAIGALPIGANTKGLINLVTNKELIDHEKQLENLKKAEEAQQQDPILDLAAYIKTAYEAAKQAKSDIEQDLLKARRQRDGKYDPDKLARIEKFGGTKIFMMLTNVKCRAAEAWIKDILIPPGDKPWALNPTPVPELPQAIEVDIAEIVTNEVAFQIVASGFDPAAANEDEIQVRMQEIHDEILEQKKERAKKATNAFEQRIEDDLVEGRFYDALAEFVNDLSTFRAAFIKGPVTRKQKRLVWTEDQNGAYVPAIEEKYIKEYNRVSPFDIYPSPGAKTIQDGYLCERVKFRRSALQQMIGVPGFSTHAVRAVLNEHGTGGLREWLAVDQERADAESRPQEFNDPDPPIDAVEFWGSIQGKKLLEWGMDKKQIPDPDIDYQTWAILIGRWVIAASLNSNPLGHRPYYSSAFEKNNDSIWGKGPPALMRDIQDICNAIARALINNLGIASGPQVEVNYDRLAPGEDYEDVYPWKITKTKSDKQHGKPAINFYQPNPLTEVLIKVYEYFFKQASEQSGIPAYTYGNEDVGGAGKTASGLSMLMNAASKTLKGVVFNIDLSVIKPIIYHHWLHLMLYETDILKTGDINVVARASEYLIMEEQLNIRRKEFLDGTNNQIDLAIMGLRGRANVLREVAKKLKLPVEDIIPPDEMFMQQSQFQPADAAGANATAPGGPPPSPGGAPALPPPAVIDAAGGRKGAEPARTME